MSEQELQEFVRVMKRVREANTASPERARAMLVSEGYLTADGKIAEPYRSDSAHAKPARR